MLRRRARGRSAPPEPERGEDSEHLQRGDTPPIVDERHSRDADGDPSRQREDGGATESGGDGNQEAMRAAVLEALSDPASNCSQLVGCVSVSGVNISSR